MPSNLEMQYFHQLRLVIEGKLVFIFYTLSHELRMFDAELLLMIELQRISAAKILSGVRMLLAIFVKWANFISRNWSVTGWVMDPSHQLVVHACTVIIVLA